MTGAGQPMQVGPLGPTCFGESLRLSFAPRQSSTHFVPHHSLQVTPFLHHQQKRILPFLPRSIASMVLLQVPLPSFATRLPYLATHSLASGFPALIEPW